MSVDRNGTAWVLYGDGNIFHVDTKTGACQASGYVTGKNGFSLFGMGFVANGPGSNDETLFLGSSMGLGKLDPMTLVPTLVGAYNGVPNETGEMTGTGDGHLFGYFTSSGVSVAEIDKTNANILSKVDLPQVPAGGSWAFSFWAGGFYLFNSSTIRHYDQQTGVKTIIPDVGFDIVGAGVSTCAPVMPPK
jgi:hypothetical protein